MKRRWGAYLVCTFFLPFVQGVPPAIANDAKWRIEPNYSTPSSPGVNEQLSIEDNKGQTRIFYKESKAVFIIESDYEHNEAWKSVTGPATKHADMLKSALEERGFHVYIWNNLKSLDLKLQLAEIFAKFGNLRDGRLLFYYYGHGYRIEPTSDQTAARAFLVPIDAPDPVKDEDGFLSLAINLTFLRQYAQDATTKHIFFALEACQAGAILYDLGGPAPQKFAKGYLLDPVVQNQARQVLTAGKNGQDVPADGTFTETLVEGLRKQEISSDGYVTGQELMTYVKTTVPQREQGQVPETGVFKQTNGDFVFGLAQPSVPTAAPSTAEQGLAKCRRPENGFESWGSTVQWTADSGWISGGSDPNTFCRSQKIVREHNYPNRNVAIANTQEEHRSIYNPFKHDEYRYTCSFVDGWDPVYREAPNPACGKL